MVDRCWSELTWPDVSVVDGDISVSVGAVLLVVEAQSVENLVLDGARTQTAPLPEGDILSSPLATEVRPTPARTEFI